VARIRRAPAGDWDRSIATLFAAAFAASALLGFNYTRDRFGGVAAVFYAAASYAALRAILVSLDRYGPMKAVGAIVLIAALGCGWSLRAIGTVQGLREAAWAQRREWLADSTQRRADFAGRPTYLALMRALYTDATDPRAAAPREPRWFSRMVGDW
jgi:hypothetical protein